MRMIDEFRIRVDVKVSRIKTKLCNMLIYLANKIDCNYTKRLQIDAVIKIDLQRYLPPDGKWRHCAITVDWWMCINGSMKKDSVHRQAAYIEGKEVAAKEFHDIGEVDIKS